MKKQVVEAISYWINVTGLELNDYVNPPKDLEGYSLWLHTRIKKLLHPYKVSGKELLENKDLFMGEDTKKGDGSFYTPKIWADEAHKVLKQHVPNLEDFNVWDASCGTGNLIESFTDCKQLFASTLFEEDVITVQERLPHSFAFQCDFLSKIDHNNIFKEFTNGLPEELQEVFDNDEPIIFHMNPPYATKDAFQTDVGKHLKTIGETDIGADLLRQFVWRVYDIIDKNNLTNAYISIVGTQSMYILPKWESIVKLQQDYSDYVDGFVFKASEFSGVNESVKWGIFYSLWKYDNGDKGENFFKPMKKIHYDFKENIDNKVVKTGDINLDYSRPYIKDFNRPDDLSDTKMVVPVANYKGEISLTNDGKAKLYSASDNILAYTLDKGSFKDITNFLGVSTLPATLNVIPMTKGNFDKTVAQFLHNSFYSEDFISLSSAYKAPMNYGDEKFKEYYANGLLHLPFGRKSLITSYRGLEYAKARRDFPNNLFPISVDEIKKEATNEKILADISKIGGTHNQFYLSEVEANKHLAWDSVLELYEFGLEFLMDSINKREEHVNPLLADGMLDTWDCGFRTLRFSTLATPQWEEKYAQILKKVRKEVRERTHDYFQLLE